MDWGAMGLFLNNRPLLDAYRRGEPQAFAAIYEAYARKVADLLRHGFQFESQGRTLRFQGFSSPLDLEVFTQEVFLRTFSESARQGYDGLRPFGPYVLRIARNRVIDEIRKRRVELEKLVGPFDEGRHETTEQVSLDERLDAARALRLVRAFVASRSELERRYVSARFAQDLSLLAAARALGITRMRARILERKLLGALREHLRRAGYVGDAGGAHALAMMMVI